MPGVRQPQLCGDGTDARDRMAWIAIGAAVLAWGIGDTIWTFTVSGMSDPPYPSVADIFPSRTCTVIA